MNPERDAWPSSDVGSVTMDGCAAPRSPSPLEAVDSRAFPAHRRSEGHRPGVSGTAFGRVRPSP